MDKDQEIWLTPEELQQMLQGTVVWSDVAPRLTPVPGRRSGIRRLGEPLPYTPPGEPGQLGRAGGHPGAVKPGRGDEPGGAVTREKIDGSYVPAWEGKPVIALLGGVGLVTGLSWGYFLLLR